MVVFDLRKVPVLRLTRNRRRPGTTTTFNSYLSGKSFWLPGAVAVVLLIGGSWLIRGNALTDYTSQVRQVDSGASLDVSVDSQSSTEAPKNEISETTINTSAENTANENSATNSSVSVTVNGQSINVPENGTVHRTITSDNGQAEIDINVQSDSTSGSFNSSTSITNVHGFSSNMQSTNEVQIRSSQ